MSEQGGDRYNLGSATMTFQEFTLRSFHILMIESTEDGLGEYYEDGIDNLYCSIPDDRKTTVEKEEWVKIDGHRAPVNAQDKERGIFNRERVLKKRQLCTNILDRNRLLFGNPNFTRQMLYEKGGYQDAERSGEIDDRED